MSTTSSRRQKVTFELIEPLVVFYELEGRAVYVEFALPGSDEVFESKANIRTSTNAGAKVKKRVTRMARNQVRRSATRAIRGALGGGMVGRMGSMSFNTAAREAKVGEGPTQKQIEEAIVKAFERVAVNFHYDEERGEWTKSSAAPPPPPKSPFEEQLAQHPIADPHDKNVFARVLAELAYADGHVAPEEAELFREIIPPDQPGLDTLAKADPVSTIEAQEVTQGVKGTIFMFAWVIACVDLDLDPVEEELLLEYADVFELNDSRREELIRMAKYFVLERNIEVDTPRDELFALADKIKLSNDDAERCRIAFKRRVG